MFIGYIIFGVVALISWAISANLQSKFKKYSKIPIPYGMTGKMVAEKMLHDHGIFDVQVISTSGQLTDHYNPLTKTVNLSEGVYGSNSVAAAAVAAQTGDASWAIVWMTNISQVQCDGSTLPHVAFAVVPCSSIGGNGVVRFENVTFTSGVAKAIAEATIETN